MNVMELLYPQKLKSGDTIRVIAPSCALATIPSQVVQRAEESFAQLGLRVTWGENVGEMDVFECAPIQSRVADFHDAFADPKVKAVFPVRGGWNANQLLDYIDWEIVRKNPKVFCGFSDITVLQNAMLSQAGLVSYSGPNFSTLGWPSVQRYTIQSLQQCLLGKGDPFALEASEAWVDAGPEEQPVQNEGMSVIWPGRAEGTIIGGNLCTFNLLQGTPYMPSLAGAILFIEEDSESSYKTVDRDLQSLLHVPEFSLVRGLVVGRFQKGTNMTPARLKEMFARRPELRRMPVVVNADFGHTEPKATFPIGGRGCVTADAVSGKVDIEIIQY